MTRPTVTCGGVDYREIEDAFATGEGLVFVDIELRSEFEKQHADFVQYFLHAGVRTVHLVDDDDGL